MTSNKIRLSAPDWCFFREGSEAETYYATLKEMGYDAVEMVPAQRRKAARSAGLTIQNYAAPGMGAGLNNRANHTKLIDRIRATIRETENDDIPHVIIFSGNRVDGVDDGFDACTQAIEQVLPDTEKAGRVLIFEMLNSYNHPGYEADNSPFGFELAKYFNSPNLKVLLDLHHMHRMGEDPVALIRDNIEHIAHLHVAGSPNRDFPGSAQTIDYASCVRAAIESAYDGFWGMEFVPSGNKLEEAAKAVELFRNYFEISSRPGATQRRDAM